MVITAFLEADVDGGYLLVMYAQPGIPLVHRLLLDLPRGSHLGRHCQLGLVVLAQRFQLYRELVISFLVKSDQGLDLLIPWQQGQGLAGAFERAATGAS